MKNPIDPLMLAIRQWINEQGMTLQELGTRMGYPTASARACAWRFLKSGNPYLDQARRFAEAIGAKLSNLLEGKFPKQAKDPNPERDWRFLIEYIESEGGRVTARNVQIAFRRQFPVVESAQAALDALVSLGIGDFETQPRKKLTFVLRSR